MFKLDESSFYFSQDQKLDYVCDTVTKLGLDSFVTTSTTNKIIIRIILEYNSHHRHYHNLDHIVWGLHQLERLDPNLFTFDAELLKWAFIYHDMVMVFDKNCTSNEQLSADLAVTTLSSAAKSTLKNRLSQLKDLILHTSTHESHSLEIFNLLHDVDYSILASSNIDAIQKYDDGIYNEWCNTIPVITFRQNRKAFLEKLLTKPVFFSQPFQQYNIQAINNIKHLLVRYAT